MNQYLAAVLTATSTWWTGFCERHLVADHPVDVIRRENRQAPPELREYLLGRYRYLAPFAYYGNLQARKDLGEVGEELRAYGIHDPIMDDYREFER